MFLRLCCEDALADIGGMPINDEHVRDFQRRLTEMDPSVELSFEEAKQRYHELLHLYWVLAHRPPNEGGPKEHPPPPPWL